MGDLLLLLQQSAKICYIYLLGMSSKVYKIIFFLFKIDYKNYIKWNLSNETDNMKLVK